MISTLPAGEVTGLTASIIGVVMQTPDMRFTANGTPVGNATLAYVHKGQYVYVRVSMFGARARDTWQYAGYEDFDVGSIVSAAGAFGPEWYDTDDGKRRSTLQLTAADVRVITPRDEQLHADVKARMEQLRTVRAMEAPTPAPAPVENAAPPARAKRKRTTAATGEAAIVNADTGEISPISAADESPPIVDDGTDNPVPF